MFVIGAKVFLVLMIKVMCMLRPKADAPEQTIALIDIAKQLEDKGLSLPALVRFPQILHQPCTQFMCGI